MNRQQLELIARQATIRALAGQKTEDSRIELKATYKEDHRKMARQLGGQANAMLGEAVIWIMGVDEKGKVITGVEEKETRDWYSQVTKYFDSQVAPRLTLDIGFVPEGETDKTVVALYFETDDAPYIVTVDNRGAVLDEAKNITRDVPWRSETLLRSAGRADFLRMLVPRAQLPTIEVLQGRLRTATQADGYRMIWTLELDLYAVPQSMNTITIPFHKCECLCQIPSQNHEYRFRRFGMGPRQVTETIPNGNGPQFVQSKSLSQTIAATVSEVHITGAGLIKLRAQVFTRYSQYFGEDAHIMLRMRPVHTEHVLLVEADFEQVPDHENHWKLKNPQTHNDESDPPSAAM